VIRGNLLVIPIENSLLYVSPLYLRAEQGQLPELKRVIAAYGDHVVMKETLARGSHRNIASRQAQVRIDWRVPRSLESLDNVALRESLLINGRARVQRARDPGGPGAQGLAGYGQRLGANQAGFEGGHFVRTLVGWIGIPSAAGGRAQHAAQLLR
jgi:hypothetical protein